MSREKTELQVTQDDELENYQVSILIHLAVLMVLSVALVWKHSAIVPLKKTVPVRLIAPRPQPKPGSASKPAPVAAARKSVGETKPVAKPRAQPKAKTKPPTPVRKVEKPAAPAPKAPAPRPKAVSSPQNVETTMVETKPEPVVVQEVAKPAETPRPALRKPTFETVSQFTPTPTMSTPIAPPMPTQRIGDPLQRLMPGEELTGLLPNSDGNLETTPSGADAPAATVGGGEFEVAGIESAGGFSERFEPPRVLRRVMPDYPEWARRQGVRGQAVYRVLIQESGTVGDVMAMSSTIDPRLAITGAKALRRWVFSPVLAAGEPQATWVQITIQFKLN